MTDEEMAEEEYKNCKFEKIEHYCDMAIFITGFLAGLKAGKPQWHDLRKDPNDLPKDDENYICLLEEGHKFECYYDPTTKKWYDNFFHHDIEYGYYQSKVIAWCEIPQFKE